MTAAKKAKTAENISYPIKEIRPYEGGAHLTLDVAENTTLQVSVDTKTLGDAEIGDVYTGDEQGEGAIEKAKPVKKKA